MSLLQTDMTNFLAWNDILEKRKTSAETNKVDVADIVFCGVNIVIPLVSEQMLKVCKKKYYPQSYHPSMISLCC